MPRANLRACVYASLPQSLDRSFETGPGENICTMGTGNCSPLRFLPWVRAATDMNWTLIKPEDGLPRMDYCLFPTSPQFRARFLVRSRGELEGPLEGGAYWELVKTRMVLPSKRIKVDPVGPKVNHQDNEEKPNPGVTLKSVYPFNMWSHCVIIYVMAMGCSLGLHSVWTLRPQKQWANRTSFLLRLPASS